MDDLVITGADLGEISLVKSQLVATFQMKDLGDLHYFIRIEVIQAPKDILISQCHYYVLNMLFFFSCFLSILLSSSMYLLLFLLNSS